MALTSLPGRLVSQQSIVPIVILAAVVSGIVGATGFSIASIGLLALAVVAATAAIVGRRTPQVWAFVLGGVLVGYAFFGRGFAHIGYPPLFVGEVALGLGFLAAIIAGWRHSLSVTEWALIAFAGWGVWTTVPYVSTYQVDAIRDAAFWGYVSIALLVSALLRTRKSLERIVVIYAVMIPSFLLWVPIGKFIPRLMGDIIPRTPDGVPVMVFKDGDMAVHLAAVAAFALAGLFATYSTKSLFRSSALFWALWLLGFMVTLRSRAAMLALVIGVAVAVVLRPSARLIPLGLVAMLGISLVLLVNPVIENSGPRDVSVRQVAENMTSIFNNDVSPSLDGTKRWRLEWWTEIIDYTIKGPYFWTGKGFGINLAVDDGFEVSAQGLRSPHNAHMTALARMGVPGLTVWTVFHLFFGLTMARFFLRARRARDQLLVGVSVWVLAYWVGAMINGAFDVYLEGPQGAFWLWTMVGIGIAANRLPARTDRSIFQREVPS